jgi:hypothetical protein
MTTRVIFCKFAGYDDPIAVFVDILYSYGQENVKNRLVLSYEHVGQHGAFSIKWFDRRTRDSRECEILTNHADFQDLLDELVNIEYNDLVIITAYKRIKKNESLG